MSVAIRTATRVQDQDDVNVTVGAGVDEYALCWDNDTAKFVLRAVSAGVTDHGALSGLSDDDHSQYILVSGSRAFTGSPTAPGAGSGSERFGSGATAVGANAVSIGNAATAGGTAGVSFGQAATASGAFTVAIGKSATANGDRGIAIGQNSVATEGSVAIGFSVITTSYVGSFVFGRSATATKSQQVVFGSSLAAINEFYVYGLSATTNAVIMQHVLDAHCSGTAAAGFGGGLAFNLQSSTTASQSAGLIASSWIVATHASRTARLALSAYDYNGAREGVRIDTDGSAPLLGFYGHSAVAQQVLATGAGASADDIITALQALGLVKQS